MPFAIIVSHAIIYQHINNLKVNLKKYPHIIING